MALNVDLLTTVGTAILRVAAEGIAASKGNPADRPPQNAPPPVGPPPGPPPEMPPPPGPNGSDPSPSMANLQLPLDLVQKITKYWRQEQYTLAEKQFQNPKFRIRHSYTLLTYRGRRKALLHIDKSFIDTPKNIDSPNNDVQLDNTLRDLAYWEDTLQQIPERQICIFSKELNVPFLLVRLTIEKWNHDSNVRIVPWQDVDYIESLKEVREKREWISNMLALAPVEDRMAITFETEEIDRLTDILARTDYFLDAGGRKIVMWRAGISEYWKGDLTGTQNAEIAAGLYLVTLAGVGRKPGIIPVGALLKFIHDIPTLPGDSATYIQRIIDKYSLNPAAEAEGEDA